MRTSSRRTREAREETTPLPPPPAPPARDANPWPMPSTHVEPGGHELARARPAAPRADTEPAGEAGDAGAAPGVAVALGLAFMVLVGALVRFRESVDLADLTGVLFIIVMLVVFALTRVRRAARRQARRRAGGRGA